MKRADSASCLLPPRYSINGDSSPRSETDEEQRSVTMITTTRLPHYSTERFYMLSEIGEHSFSIQCMEELNESIFRESSYVILYILCGPEYEDNIFHFVESILIPNTRKLHDVIIQERKKDVSNSPCSTGTSPRAGHGINKEMDCTNIYLVIDKIYSRRCHNRSDEAKVDDETYSKESYHASQVKIVEELARSVAKSKVLRSLAQGISIGVTSERKAAPACETLLSAVLFSSAKRRRLIKYNQHRRKNQPNNNLKTQSGEVVPQSCGSTKSFISILTLGPNDLLGIPVEDEVEDLHAVQDIIQSVTRAEWNGNGDAISFAKRAQSAWKKFNNCFDIDDEFIVSNQGLKEEPWVIFMVLAFWVVVIGIGIFFLNKN